jgi:hypothetical protein
VLRARVRGQIRRGYDAFICYSQEADLRLAARLRWGMQRLAHEPLRVNALRVYRDPTLPPIPICGRSWWMRWNGPAISS